MKFMLVAVVGILLTIETVDSNLQFFLGTKTLKDSILEGTEMFHNLIFDIVDDGLQKNPEAYEMLKDPLREIRTNILANMKAMHTFAIETSLWSIKNTAEYAQAIWSQHGKNILSGNFDHEAVFHDILHFLEATEQFVAVKGLGLKPKAKDNHLD